MANPKVLIINNRDNRSGSAIFTMRLFLALRKLHVPCDFVVLHKDSGDHRVKQGPLKQGYKKFIEMFMGIGERAIKRVYLRFWHNPLVSFGLVSWLDLAEVIKHYKPDVVHLNWICGNTLRIEDLLLLNKLKIPVVWTLHDTWPLSGINHIDSKFCKASQTQGDFLQKFFERRKRRLYSKLSQLLVVAPSRWLESSIVESGLLSNAQIARIPNGVEPEIFWPRNKDTCREFLGIPKHKKLILFGAIDASADANKGLDLLLAAIEKLKVSHDLSNTVLGVFGYFDDKELPSTLCEMRLFGFVGDPQMLATLYSAADMLVVPSRIESFGQSALEARACGLPVVCFDTSGLRDIVKHKETGYLAAPYDSNDLAAGIGWALNEWTYLRAALSSRDAANNLSIERVAKMYTSIYEDLVYGEVTLEESLPQLRARDFEVEL
jgi:glycosyltransferase involved in cell wall biosynthesis